MAGAPGERWRYCSSNTFLLGVALESALIGSRRYGVMFYLYDRLFDPLSIRDYLLGGQTSANRKVIPRSGPKST